MKSKLEQILNSPILGYAHHRILLDDQGRPCDYEFLEVNETFEKLTGLRKKQVIGRTIRQVMPGIEQTAFDWIGCYGAVALGGREKEFEQYSEPLKRWYRVHVSSPERLFFTTMFIDISESKKQTEELEGFFTVNPDLLCIADLEGRFIKTNEAWTRVLGYSTRELNQRKFLEFVHPDDLQATIKAMADLGTGQEVLGFTNRYRCRDGSYRHIEWRSHPKGNLIYAAARDVTERKRAEEALSESKQFVETLLSAIPVAVFFKDRQGRYIGCNDVFTQVTGITAAELSGKTVYELWPSDLSRTYHEKDLELLKTRQHQFYEFWVKDKDGIIRPVIFAKDVFLDAEGNPAGIVGAFFDITERKVAEEALREERERLEHILSITGTGIDIVDGDFNLHFVDKGWQKIYGDPTGRKCYEYFNGLNEPCPECGIPIALETKQITVTEEVLPRENNRIVEVHIIPFQNAEGQWLVAEFNVDITNRKRVEAEKDKLQAQLVQAQKIESVGRLAGGVAHDFNNMLGVILGQAELALLKLGPNEPLYKGLAEIQKAARHSADLVKQLLAFARKQTISPRPLNLNDTVEGMLNMMRRLIGEDIDLLWKPGRDLWPVEIDPVQVDQILANLCVNARDAISGVGKITIETGRVVFDRDYCSRHPGFVPGEFVLLAVSDNGCGMDSETLAHLFEPFFTTKEVGLGTGLGLASVYGAVKQNQGFINVYSELGQGSTFKIYLPRHLDQAARSKEKPPLTSAECGSETILLVEDEPMILEVTKTMLEMLGYRVLAAGTPGEAMRRAREYEGWIHLLMTDVVMPEMNGRDLAGKLLSLYPDIKCLFMSGYTANVIAHHGVLDEGVYFIQKPFSLDGLGAKMREALE